MYSYSYRSTQSSNQAVANIQAKKVGINVSGFKFEDNRPQSVLQKKQAEFISNYTVRSLVIQKMDKDTPASTAAGAAAPASTVASATVVPIASSSAGAAAAAATAVVAPHSAAATGSVPLAANQPAISAAAAAGFTPGNVNFVSSSEEGIGSIYFNGGRIRLHQQNGPQVSPHGSMRGHVAQAGYDLYQSMRAQEKSPKERLEALKAGHHLRKIDLKADNRGMRLIEFWKDTDGEVGGHTSRGMAAAAPAFTQQQIDLLHTAASTEGENDARTDALTQAIRHRAFDGHILRQQQEAKELREEQALTAQAVQAERAAQALRAQQAAQALQAAQARHRASPELQNARAIRRGRRRRG